MHKTIGRSVQPNIGSKKQNFLGHCPRPHNGGVICTPQTPSDLPTMQSVQRRGGSAPPLTPPLTKWASRGKNITQPNKCQFQKISSPKYHFTNSWIQFQISNKENTNTHTHTHKHTHTHTHTHTHIYIYKESITVHRWLHAEKPPDCPTSWLLDYST